MTWDDFEGLTVPSQIEAPTRKRYSVTADVLSYRLCRRQYCFNAHRGYIPSQPTQQFVGTIIHQVLDRAHSHFMGKVDESTKGSFPTDKDIEGYFIEVENALLAHGIRAISPQTRNHTLGLIQSFNTIEGPVLYPRIVDTEHRLQAERRDYVLNGVVDVLASSDAPQDLGGMEIWDYKGTRKPKSNTPSGATRLRDYMFQMQVYSELYNQRNGKYPKRAVIYFIGELANLDGQGTRPKNALMQADLEPEKIQEALREFDLTVTSIQDSMTRNDWTPPGDGAGKETCDLCDVRWSCTTMGAQYRANPRYP